MASKQTTNQTQRERTEIKLRTELSKEIKRQGISMREAARQIGIDQSNLSRYLNGTRKLETTSEDTLAALASIIEDEKKADAWFEAAKPEFSPEMQRRIKKAFTYLEKRDEVNTREGVFVVLGAMEGALVNEEGMEAVDTFMRHHDARRYILLSRAHLNPLSNRRYPLADYILENCSEDIRYSVTFNKYLVATSEADLRPYTPDPLSMVGHWGSEDGRSYIHPHPTQNGQTYYNPHGKHARVHRCTGMITYPKYRSGTSGVNAYKRHKMGGLIVEVTKGRFHVREFQFAADGGFWDICGGVLKRYNPDGTVTEALTKQHPSGARVVTFGDSHGGVDVWGDPEALNEAARITQIVRPDFIVKQDVYDASSSSHHKAKSMRQRIESPKAGRLIPDEIAATRRHLEWVRAICPTSQVIIANSNHDGHLAKHIDEGRFIHDVAPNLLAIIPLLAPYLLEGKDPAQVAVDPDMALAQWLGPNERFSVDGVEYNNHGHAGLNGAKGNKKSDSKVYGPTVGGHSHEGTIYHDGYRAGTMTQLRMGYNNGPSSHCHGIVIQYPDQQRQLIHIIDGKGML